MVYYYFSSINLDGIVSRVRHICRSNQQPPSPPKLPLPYSMTTSSTVTIQTSIIDRLRRKCQMRVNRFNYRLSHSSRAASWLLANADHHLSNSFLEIFAYLPDDLLENVFRFLPSIEIPRISRVCRRWHHIVCERRNFLPKVQYTRLALDIIDDTINGCLVRFGDRDLSCADVVIEPPVSAERMMLASKHFCITNGIELCFSVLTASHVNYLQLNLLQFDHIIKLTLLMEPTSLYVEDLYALIVALLTNRQLRDTTLSICFRHDNYRPTIATMRRQLVDSHARSLRKTCHIRKIQEIRHKHYCRWNLTLIS